MNDHDAWGHTEGAPFVDGKTWWDIYESLRKRPYAKAWGPGADYGVWQLADRAYLRDPDGVTVYTTKWELVSYQGSRRFVEDVLEGESERLHKP